MEWKNLTKQQIINIAVAAAMVLVLVIVFCTMNAKCNDLAAQLSEAKKNAAASHGEDAELIDDLSARLSSVLEAKNAADAELTELKAAKDALGLEHNELVAKLADAEKKLSATSELAVSLQGELGKAEKQVEEMTAQIAAQTASEAELNAQIAALTDAKTALEAQAAELTAAKTALEAQTAALSDDKTALEAQVAALTAEKEALQKQLDEAGSEDTADADAAKQIADLTAANAELEAQVASLTEANTNLIAVNAELKEEIAWMDSTITQMEAEIEFLFNNQNADAGEESVATTIVNAFYTANEGNLPAFMMLDDEAMRDFYGMDPAWLTEYACTIPMMNVHATEVFVAKVADGQMDNVKTAIEARKAALDATWSRYLPAQYELVKNSITVEKDGYILFAVTEYTDSIQSIFEDTIK